MNGAGPAVAAFERVRDLPYATNAAFDAAGLRVHFRGNCVAKAACLTEDLAASGLATRLVSWEYELPVLVEVEKRLRFRTDLHTATEVYIDGEWILVDATHDPRLGRLGLTVGRWDGRTPTEPAHPAVGPVLLHDDPESVARLNETRSWIRRQVESTAPEFVTEYQRAFNELLEQTRR